MKAYSKKSAKTNASVLIRWYDENTIQTKLITENRSIGRKKRPELRQRHRYTKDTFFDKIVLICIKKSLSDI